MSCQQYCSTFTTKACTAVDVVGQAALDYVAKTILNYNVALSNVAYDGAVAPLIISGGKRFVGSVPSTCESFFPPAQRIWFV